jgi:hypothetical protein
MTFLLSLFWSPDSMIAYIFKERDYDMKARIKRHKF